MIYNYLIPIIFIIIILYCIFSKPNAEQVEKTIAFDIISDFNNLYSKSYTINDFDIIDIDVEKNNYVLALKNAKLYLIFELSSYDERITNYEDIGPNGYKLVQMLTTYG